MELAPKDLDTILVDGELKSVLAYTVPSPLGKQGIEELFLICACIDDPRQTDGVQVEINYDECGYATGGAFFIHSFGLLEASKLGEDFFPLIEMAWNSAFTSAAYTETADGDDAYTVLPFGATDEVATEAVRGLIQQPELRSALSQSLVMSPAKEASVEMLNAYCRAVLGNLDHHAPKPKLDE